MKQFFQDPASNINSLNTIIPALISQQDKIEAITSFSKIIKTLHDNEILSQTDIKCILFFDESEKISEQSNFCI